jgi:hypothetical protein
MPTTDIAGYSAVPPTIADTKATLPAPQKATIPTPVPKRYILVSASLKVVGQDDDAATSTQMADAIALETGETVYVARFSEATVHVPRVFPAPQPPVGEPQTPEQVASQAEQAARKAAKGVTEAAARSLKVEGFQPPLVNRETAPPPPAAPAKATKPQPTRAEREVELNALSADEVKALTVKAGFVATTKAENIQTLLNAEF